MRSPISHPGTWGGVEMHESIVSAELKGLDVARVKIYKDTEHRYSSKL